MPTRRNYNKYQYETSPKKLQPEYEPKPQHKVPKKSTAKKVDKEPVKKNQKKKITKIKTIFYVVISFVILFAIGYRNSQINESFVELQTLKTDLALIQKENEQLRVNIENSLNLNNIEKEAKEKLGMQKLDNKQKIYVNLQKRDYVQPATEKIVEEETWFQKIINYIKNIL